MSERFVDPESVGVDFSADVAAFRDIIRPWCRTFGQARLAAERLVALGYRKTALTNTPATSDAQAEPSIIPGQSDQIIPAIPYTITIPNDLRELAGRADEARIASSNEPESRHLLRKQNQTAEALKSAAVNWLRSILREGK